MARTSAKRSRRPPHPRSSREVVCFLAAALVAALLIAADHTVLSELLQRTADVSTLDAVQRAVPPAAGTRAHDVVLLPGALDGKWFLVHTENLLSGDSWRIRWSALDNAPHGREVHWASLVPWLLALWSWVLAAFHSGTVLQQVPSAAISFGPVSFIAALALLAWLVWRRFGLVPAALALLILSTACPFVDMFRTGQVDHHGLAAVFCMASVFCVGAGGAGVTERGRKLETWWYAAGGVFGALGLWVSAATALPVLVACGLGAILAVASSAGQQGVVVWPGAFWRWAVAGATTSLGCYLLEYFPVEMGWRLEVNHPLYAMAWLGGGWWLARVVSFLGRWRNLEIAPSSRVPGGWAAGTAAVIALASPLALILALRTKVFVVSDPFLYALHKEYISEFKPAWVALSGPGLGEKLLDLYWWPFLFLILVILLWQNRAVLSPSLWAPVVFGGTAALVAQAEAVLQVRWGGLALSLWIASLLLAAGTCWERRSQLQLRKRSWVALGVFVVVGMLPAPVAAVRHAIALGEVKGTPIPKNFVPSLLLRDVAHRLIRVSPGRVPVVLSDPTSSSELAFYGGLHVIGALYWENLPGLLRAAHIFNARTEAEAKHRLLDAGVNYVVQPSWDAFSEMEAYSGLLAELGETSDGGKPYLARVLSGEEQPDWARPIHYPIPEAFGVEESHVDIFEFVPDQSPFQAQRARGLYEFERGDWGAAIRHFEAAMQIHPSDTEIPAWLAGLRRRVGAPPPSPQSP